MSGAGAVWDETAAIAITSGALSFSSLTTRCAVFGPIPLAAFTANERSRVIGWWIVAING